MMKRKLVGFCSALILGLTLAAPSADAQLRSQGKVLEFGEDDDGNTLFQGPTVDHAQEMRRLIQNIAKYGRKFKRDFVVLVRDAKGLMTQVVDVDLLLSAPSSTYLQAIDGLIEPDLSFGKEEFGEATSEKDQKDAMDQLKVANDVGLKVFTIDYASKPKDVDKAIRFAQKNKFVPYVAPGRGFQNNKLPNWPRRPVNENSHTISNVGLVKNYLLIEESSRMGSAAEYAMKIHNTNYDLVATPVFHHRSQTLGRDNVRKMQFKKLGSRRPVLAIMNIGTADVGAFYWKDSWRQGNPSFVLELAPFSSDHHLVQYWHPSWHQLMYGNTMSYLYGIIKEGYDGVVLDGVNVYEIFANPE
ncbi:hypothetical protein RYZ26_03020 [Terasakiella sp. A23]|uniref:hypothetical protein n=1 Tax=Terasakiella sp. FCG-A23 TaxID=3080561 RepID=UPI002955792A|nr:hypothetical protein [Terasakiella sp. A23]MDV7338552.1 hypothetical protein [Terasakiella sp. A23]